MLSAPEDQLITMLRQQAEADYIGEPLSQLEHALQCASLASETGADEELILASLLHDIGHICDPRAERMVDVGVRLHEHVGADYVRSLGIAPAVAELIEQHVNAKRYLVYKHDSYRARLSDASKRTLEVQGGAMDAGEAARFECHPRFDDILKLRAWDEAAKRVDAAVPALDTYREMLARNRVDPLTRAQLASWEENGFLKIEGWFAAQEISALREAVAELEALPETAGKWMKYFEQTTNGRQLCRVENFIGYQLQLAQLVSGSATLRLVSALFGERAALFKEKINFKLPKGKGFIAHQDAPAFTSFAQSFHITLMFSFDAATTANGCLEVVRGGHGAGLLPTATDLTIDPQTRNTLDWMPVPMAPGDLLLFGSFLPHRSGDNDTDDPRRALYATYNMASEGEVRDQYFSAKRASFPPEIEREPGKQYDPGVFNVGNPVITD